MGTKETRRDFFAPPARSRERPPVLCAAKTQPGSGLGVIPGRGSVLCSPTHSLCYFYLHQPEPSQALSQFPIRAYLDDQPIAHFDRLTWKMEPLVPWMEEMDKEMFLAPTRVFRADLEKLSKLGYQTGGLHTRQAMLCCQLREDGSKEVILRYGYDGMDFLSFDKETLTWMAAQPQEEKAREKWKAERRWSKMMKRFLEETCTEWLQIYQSYMNKTLQRIEPPVGKVTRKEVDVNLEILICQAFGFHPKEIQASWMRDREVCQYKTFPRNVAPNSDGTYYLWLSVEIDPKERDLFRCRLEHQGLQEPLILAFKEETGWWIFMAIVATSVLGLGIFFLICCCKRRTNNLCLEVTICHDPAPSKNIPSIFVHHKEDETQSMSLQTSEHKASCGLQRTQGDPEIRVLSSPQARSKATPEEKKTTELSTLAALHRRNRKETRKTHP